MNANCDAPGKRPPTASRRLLDSQQEILYLGWGWMVRLHLGSVIERCNRAAIGWKAALEMVTPCIVDPIKAMDDRLDAAPRHR